MSDINRLLKHTTTLAALAAFFVAGGGRLIPDTCPSHDAVPAVDEIGHHSGHTEAHHEPASHETPAGEHEHDGCTCVDSCCGTATPKGTVAQSLTQRWAEAAPTLVRPSVPFAPRGADAAYVLPFANAPPLLV